MKIVLFILSSLFFFSSLLLNSIAIEEIYNDVITSGTMSFLKGLVSFGFSIVFFRVLNYKMRKNKWLIFLIVPLFSFGVFFAIDPIFSTISDNVSIENKQNVIDSHIIKRGVKLDIDFFNNNIKDKNGKYKSYVSSLQFLNANIEPLELDNKYNSSIYSFVLVNDIKENRSLYKSNISEAYRQQLNMYKEYHRIDNLNDYFSSMKTKEAYGKINSLTTKYSKKYLTYKRSYTEYLRKEKQKVLYEITAIFRAYISCNRAGCLENNNKQIENFFSNNRQYGFENISTSQSCVFDNVNAPSKATIRYINDIDKDIDNFNRISKITDYKRVVCYYDARENERIFYRGVKEEFARRTGIYNFSADNFPQFKRSGELKRTIIRYFNNEYNVNIPNSTNIYDYNDLEDAFKSSFNQVKTKEIEKQIKESFGYDIPRKLSKHSFSKNKNVVNELNNKFSSYYYLKDFNYLYEKVTFDRTDHIKSMIKAFEKHYQKNGSEIINEQKNNFEYLNKEHKKVFNLYFCLLIILFLMFLNILLSVKDIIVSIFKLNNKIDFILLFAISFSIVLLPIFIENTYLNETMLLAINEDVFKMFLYKWFLNIQLLINIEDLLIMLEFEEIFLFISHKISSI